MRENRVRPGFLFALLFGAAAAFAAEHFDTPLPGQWSRAGAYLWPGPAVVADLPEEGRNLTIPSPDGSATVQVVGHELAVARVDGATYGPFPVEALAEVLWSPDSRAVAITSSDGGWVGNWSVKVLRVADGKSTDPASQALKRFRRELPQCPAESPNAGAVGWQSGGRLAILVEMPCHGSCERMCTQRGYVVDARTGNVLRRLDERQVAREWRRLLGERFGAAGK